MNPSDDMARLRAEMDQATAMAGEFAGTTASYFKALIEQGLERDEAIALTIAWITALAGGVR